MKVKKTGIYKITNPKKAVYIGQSLNIEKRILYYKYGHCPGQKKLYASIKKYGWQNHKFEIIHVCSEEELNGLEVYYISLFNSFDTKQGLNLQSGGNTFKCSEETRLKRSLKLKGRVMTEEWKRKIGLRSIGRMVGFKHTEESKAKMSANNARARIGISPANKGTGMSKEELRLRHNQQNKEWRLRVKQKKNGIAYQENKESKAA